MPRAATALVWLALGLVLAWALSQRALQNYWLEQAEAIAAAHQSGHSAVAFPLRGPADLVGGRPLQVRQGHFDESGLQLQLASGPANLPLAFNGRCLNARHFPRLAFDHHNSAPLRLALVHAVQAGGEQRLAEVLLPSGSGRFEVDLRRLDWRAGQSDGEARPLGAEGGRLCEFRLVPVADSDTDLWLARLRFEQGNDASPPPGPVELTFAWRWPAALRVEQAQRQDHADQAVLPRAPWPAQLGALADWIALALALLGLGGALSRRWPRPSVLLSLSAIILLLVELRPPQSWPAALALAGGLLSLLLAARTGPRSAVPARLWGGPGAWLSLLPALLLILASALAIGKLAGPSPGQWPGAIDWLRYLLWAWFQQYLLQRVFVPVLGAPAHNPTAGPLALLPAAAAFALLHLPNLELAVLCLLAGLWWARHFQRHRAWLPLIVAHAVLGSLLPELLPDSWLWSAEVGWRYPAG